MGGIGLEHHRSSENSVPTDFFTNWGKSMGAVGLLPHEFVHAWNGKRQRPVDELTANHNIPTQNTLLWVYEGQTEYWGDVLTARSGLASKEDILVTVAENAAFYDNQPGREWLRCRMRTTTTCSVIAPRTPIRRGCAARATTTARPC